MYIYVYVCTYVQMYMCMYVCMYVCIYYIYSLPRRGNLLRSIELGLADAAAAEASARRGLAKATVRVCVCVCVCVCVYECMYTYVYTYVCDTYIHTCYVLISPPIPYITSSRCKRLRILRPVEIMFFLSFRRAPPLKCP